jgi:hypothetical protein
MDIAATVINGVVVGLVGLAVSLAGKGRFDRLERRIDRLEERLDGSINSLRSDLTQVALAVGVKPRARNA